MGISNGLVAAYNKQDSGASWLDLTGNGNNIPLTNTTWETDGLQANATGERGIADNTGSKVVNSNIGTIIMQLKGLSAFAEGVERVYFGNLIAAESSFYFRKFTDNRMWFLFRDSVGNHYVAYTAADFPNWTTGNQIAVQWNRSANIFDSKKMALNVDGVYKTPNASLNSTAWNSFNVATNLGVLNDYVVITKNANSVSGYLYLFNTIKTAAELAAINANHNIILADYRKKGSYYLPIYYS